MSAVPPAPPSARLLARLLPHAIREDVLSDMADTYADLVARHGADEAQRWYRTHSRASCRTALRARIEEFTSRVRSDSLPTPGDGLMSELLQDLRYTLRWWRHNPGFTAVALVTLALGIGANTAIFSVVHGVLLSPLPYPDADRIVRFYNTNDEDHSSQQSLSIVEVAEYIDQADMLEAVAGMDVYPVTLTGGDEPVRVRASIVTGQFFDVFGTAPLLGRAFGEEATTPGSDAVAVISHGLWQRAFGGAETVLGQDLRVNGDVRRIVGVMPAGFDYYPGTDVWLPMVIDRATLNPDQVTSHSLVAVALLPEGVDLATAQEAGDRMVGAVLEQYPQHDSFHAALFVPLSEWFTGSVRPMLITLIAAVGFMLLIVCANVASLLLSRAESRRRELAVRTALGAGRGRLARQLATESAALALTGGVLGLVAAVMVRGALVAELAAVLPRTSAIEISWPVLAYSLGASAIAGLLFGVAPALRGSTQAPSDTLRAAGSGASPSVRARGFLVTVEIALVVALLMGATLIGQSFWNLIQVEPGIDATQVVAFDLELPETSYASQPDVARTLNTIGDRLESLPGVDAVGAVSWLPFADFPSQWGIEIDGREMPEDAELPDYTIVSGNYFDSIGIPVVSGRAFRSEDSDNAVIVTESAADLYWPDTDPIGQRLRFGAETEWRTVVGVVGDYRNRGLDGEIRQGVYFPHTTLNSGDDWFPRRMSFTVRTTGSPTQIVPTIRDAVWSLDPDLPVARVQRMRDVVAGTISQPRVTLLFLGGFAGLALFLGAIGIHGVVAQSVAASQREIGIRMALGAQTHRVLARVMTASLVRVAIGLGVGLLTGYWATQVMMSTMLVGVSPADPRIWLAVSGILGVVALLATLIPATRALRVEPVAVLRGE